MMIFLALVLGVWQSVLAQTAYEELDIINLRAGVQADGSLFRDPAGVHHLEVPKDSGVFTIQHAGLWLAAKPAGALKVAAQWEDSSKHDFWPGPLDGNGQIDSTTSALWNQVWKLDKDTLDAFLLDWSDGTLNDPIPLQIQQWPARGNPYNTIAGNSDAAPFVDVDHNGQYNPAKGDYPAMRGDQSLWWVFNDQLEPHTQSGGDALGVEVQALAWVVYDPSDTILQQTFFISYTLINKSGGPLDSLFLGLWADFSIGCPLDDFIASDPTNQAFIAYNGHTIDNACVPNYGTDPPLQSVIWLNQPMDHFVTLGDDASPTGAPALPAHFFNYLRGVWKDNTGISCGGNGYGGAAACDYLYPDNPSNLAGWSECGVSNQEGKRNGLGATGPVTLQPYSSLTFDLAFSTHAYPGGFNACPDWAPVQSQIDHIRNARYGCTVGDCVWPGDANASQDATNWDVLPIGIAFGKTGAPRIAQTLDWEGRFADDWATSFKSGANHKHADTDGNGIIDRQDVAAISQNYNQVHNKTRHFLKGGAADPPIWIELSTDTALAGSTISGIVYLGTNAEQVDSAYGLAFSLTYNKDLVDSGSVTVDLSNAWLADSANLLTFANDQYQAGRIDIALTRLDQVDTTGHGEVASFNIVIIDNIDGVSSAYLDLDIEDVLLINSKENPVALKTQSDSVFIYTGIPTPPINGPLQLTIFPNPTQAAFTIAVDHAELLNVAVFGMLGTPIAQWQGQQAQVNLGTSDWEAGVYLLRIQTTQGEVYRKVVLFK